jgi:hypothetical protein
MIVFIKDKQITKSKQRIFLERPNARVHVFLSIYFSGVAKGGGLRGL